MLYRLITFSISLAVCFLIPIYYDDLLEFMVIHFHSGWVFTTLFLRFLNVIVLTIGLRYLFSIWPKTAKFKLWLLFLIALLPGLGISFIAPVYQGDYGTTSYSENKLDIEQLKSATNNKFGLKEGYQIVAFFDVGCPHCKRLSHKFGVNLDAGQKVPVTSFFPAEKDAVDNFLHENNGESFTAFSIPDSVFIANAGISFPSTYLIDKEGKTVKHWIGDLVNYTALDELLGLEAN